MQILLVMIGGFIGAIGRFGVGEWLNPNHGFPFGTLFVNLIGCFLLGWLLTYMGHRIKKQPYITLFLGTGVIGSFTTFSTFSVETIQLFDQGLVFLSLLYVLISIFFGLLLVYMGSKFA
ncbi:MAG TPA: fluoride efflux transporter CrcB [Bacillales bacterium]|nr:fluoride efflux transporter CrcB [Bacillales bacterium]